MDKSGTCGAILQHIHRIVRPQSGSSLLHCLLQKPVKNKDACHANEHNILERNIHYLQRFSDAILYGSYFDT
jgi:hypothetical protein